MEEELKIKAVIGFSGTAYIYLLMELFFFFTIVFIRITLEIVYNVCMSL